MGRSKTEFFFNQRSQRAPVSVEVGLCGMGVWGFNRAEQGDLGDGRVLQVGSPAVWKWQIPVDLVMWCSEVSTGVESIVLSRPQSTEGF